MFSLSCYEHRNMLSIFRLETYITIRIILNINSNTTFTEIKMTRG